MMYLKFNKDEITGAQLKAIAAILELDNVEDLEWFYNVHYEVCKTEIECAIENELSIEEILKVRNNPDFDELVGEYATTLYDIAESDYQLDYLYEKAETIIDINKVRKLLEMDI